MKRVITFIVMFCIVSIFALSASGDRDDAGSPYISGAEKRQQKDKEYVTGISSLAYFIPQMNKVQVLVNAEYDSGKYMDIYYPPDYLFDKKLPVVVIYNGLTGMSAKNMGRFIDWGLMLAAQGFIAVTFDAVYLDRDFLNLLDHLSLYSDELGIDNESIGVLTYCGNCLAGLKAFKLNDRPYFAGLKTGVFLYGRMIWSDDLKTESSIMLVKTGKGTEAEVKDSMDEFKAKAADGGGPSVLLLDYSTGYKYFDITENPHNPWEYGVDKQFTADCDVIMEIIDFYRKELAGDMKT